MKNAVIVREHAAIRYAERVLRQSFPMESPYDEITRIIRREIAEATPLSPMQRAIFADPRRGMSPNDEYLIRGSTVFVLTQPPRGGTRTCITIIVATPTQLATIVDISAHEEDSARSRIAEMCKEMSEREAKALAKERNRAIELDYAQRKRKILRLYLQTFAEYFGDISGDKCRKLEIMFTRKPGIIRLLKRPQVPLFFHLVGDAQASMLFWEHWQRVLDDAHLR